MKRFAVTALLLVAGVLVVEAMGDLLETRGDRTPPDSRSEVVLEVSEQRYKRELDEGAHNLIAACAGSMYSQIADEPGVVKVSDGTFKFIVEPALGPENRLKLVGCLEDFTIDHLRGDVVSVKRLDP